jgi:dienelactone hydrolase
MSPWIRISGAVILAITTMEGMATAAASSRADVMVRGKTLTLAIYRPADATSKIKGTIILGSGDVGWVGLAASMADFLSDRGYVVAGVNVRQYLAAFTSGKTHLMPSDVPGDYREVARYLRTRDLLQPPVIVSGVSEGAALAVLVGAAGPDPRWVNGVITMGLPASAELAWRWSDFTSWITKKDAAEPSFAPKHFIGSISPLPLAMVQSKKDEYVPEADDRELEAAARAPKKLILIDASNHRFTDRIADLRREFIAAVAWISTEAAVHPPR